MHERFFFKKTQGTSTTPPTLKETVKGFLEELKPKIFQNLKKSDTTYIYCCLINAEKNPVDTLAPHFSRCRRFVTKFSDEIVIVFDMMYVQTCIEEQIKNTVLLKVHSKNISTYRGELVYIHFAFEDSSRNI